MRHRCYTLAGVFSAIGFRSFPASLERCDVFIEAEGYSGPVDFRFVFRTRRHAHTGLVSLDRMQPHGATEIVFSIYDAVFDGPGDYEVQVFLPGRPLAVATRSVCVYASSPGFSETSERST